MKWKEDEGPMTEAKRIKLRAHEIMMKMHNVGVPWAKCHLAGLVCILEMKTQFLKLFNGSEEEKKKGIARFEQLEHNIKAYLSMPKQKKDEQQQHN